MSMMTARRYSMWDRRCSTSLSSLVVYFFFQAEDGIRDVAVTGVQTCALPIWWRYPADPTSCPLPRPNRRRIVHTYSAVALNNPSSSFSDLPFQSIASQRFSSSSRPDVTPKIFLAFRAFACLDSHRHPLKLVPSPWRMIVAIFTEKVSSILQNAHLILIGNRDNLAANYVARRHARAHRQTFSRKIGSQVG